MDKSVYLYACDTSWKSFVLYREGALRQTERTKCEFSLFRIVNIARRPPNKLKTVQVHLLNTVHGPFHSYSPTPFAGERCVARRAISIWFLYFYLARAPARLKGKISR